MAYFKINDTDFSMYVNALNVNDNINYNAQTNAAGNTVVDYISTKRTIEVGIIPLDDTAAAIILAAVDDIQCTISFLNPKTKALEENVVCMAHGSKIDYYTIQAGNVMINAFTLTFDEL